MGGDGRRYISYFEIKEGMSARHGKPLDRSGATERKINVVVKYETELFAGQTTFDLIWPLHNSARLETHAIYGVAHQSS